MKTVASDLRWEERSRVSSKRTVEHDLSGFVGWAVFEGELEEFLPLLHAASWIHVGKNATFGNGWVELPSGALSPQSVVVPSLS